jgi:hypothetical protein
MHMPNQTLFTEIKKGIKKDKSRMTIALCCNGDGTEKLPLLFIGKFGKPRCFKKIEYMPLQFDYKSNKTAWMTTYIMRSWLLSFIRRTKDRKVALVVDDFGPHLCAVNLLEEEKKLSDVKILWLPTNSTAEH